MKFKDDLNEKEIRAQWTRLQAAIEKKQEERRLPVRGPSTWKKYAGIAASLALIVLFSIWLTNGSSRIIYTTSNGEQKHIILPDSSSVILNSNSSLSFSNWQGREQREVVVTGEAFFSVVRTADKQRFIVRTPGGMQVDVLGTEFNVYDRRGIQRVVLNSGSVQLQYENHDMISMLPGEMVIRQGSALPQKVKVDPSRYSSWTSGRLIFDDVPVKEVCRQIEDNFGLTVSLPDPDLGNRLFNGTFPANDATVLLKALMTTYQLEAANPAAGGERILQLRRKPTPSPDTNRAIE